MFDPAVVGPTVDFLAGLAGRRGRARARHRHGSNRAAARRARRPRARHRPLGRRWSRGCRAKPGAEEIGGDDRRLRDNDGRQAAFTLAYLVFNTIMNLTTQDEQVACFQNVAAHLEPGGCFVIEVGVPGLQRLPPGEIFQPFTVTPTRLGFDEYDIARQGLVSHHYSVVDGTVHRQLRAVPLRVARGARPDGPDRRPDAARALERLAARAVHEREHARTSRSGRRPA